MAHSIVLGKLQELDMFSHSSAWRNSKLWSLAFAETLAWAGLYYMFPAFLLRWKAQFGWGLGDLSIGFTVALIVSTITGIGVGRLIDKGWARQLMAGGVLAGGLSILLLPSVNSLWQFFVS